MSSQQFRPPQTAESEPSTTQHPRTQNLTSADDDTRTRWKHRGSITLIQGKLNAIVGENHIVPWTST